MARVRPLSDLPVVVNNMATAAKAMPDDVVPVIARNVAKVVEWQGHGYYIKSRRGRKLPLTAKVKVARASRPGEAVRIVGGSPIGAWHIVEGGSQPHLITGAKERLTRRGNVRRVSARARLSEFADGQSITGRPLRIPGIGFRQYAMHPGHGPIGQPWRKAMAKSDGVVAKSLREHAEQAFTKGWLK